MTTIAYDGRSIASDSMVSKHDYDAGNTEKIKLIDGKFAVSISGSLKMFNVILPYIKNIYLDNEKVDFSQPSEYFKGEDKNWFELAVFYFKKQHGRRENSCYIDIYHNSLVPTLGIKKEFYTTGSGGDIALGAMLNGAEASQAVHLASTIDLFTGGKIVNYNILNEIKHYIIPNYKYIIHKGY